MSKRGETAKRAFIEYIRVLKIKEKERRAEKTIEIMKFFEDKLGMKLFDHPFITLTTDFDTEKPYMSLYISKMRWVRLDIIEVSIGFHVGYKLIYNARYPIKQPKEIEIHSADEFNQLLLFIHDQILKE